MLHEFETLSAAAQDQRAARLCESDADFAHWATGHGVIAHAPLTRLRAHAMVAALVARGRLPDAATGYARLEAADRVANAGMWLVAHMTYARRVRTDGSALESGDFKPSPEGHTGGALNMVPAYAGYLLANALDGRTRGWMMGQGHCVAAIDALNLLVGNAGPVHAARYDLSDDGLSRFAGDFYSYAVGPDGTPVSPLGSHVNAHTAGGMLEGGYLGFAELQYVHAPLPGERLVVFLSDGAFEEQRGSDWAPRWWRADDCGLVTPIMILNGRRIEQRSQIDQQGGQRWLHAHLRLNGFDPVVLDGRDPASIAWSILAMEQALQAPSNLSAVHLPYAIAETVKGFGFPGAGTNAAHNLPLPGNPSMDAAARDAFNSGCAALYVQSDELQRAVATLSTHSADARPRERDHALARRDVPVPHAPPIRARETGGSSSPMQALDEQFAAIINANPQLRPRVGNPDELRSNRLDGTLDRLMHRVDWPEPGVAESRTGAVITALNEEAVVCAALGNKGGINLVVTYEAFAPKMLGALRQEVIFARHQVEAGMPPRWLAVPVVLTSHTWENAKNEQSHQDPTLAEVMLGEMVDVSVVLFPADANSAAAALVHCYRQHGRVMTLVVPKRAVPHVLDAAQAQRLFEEGAMDIDGDLQRAHLQLVAIGAYQLAQASLACRRLQSRGVPVRLTYLADPARFRDPRDTHEAKATHDDATVERFFPAACARVILSHTRPEPLIGALRRIDGGPRRTRALGYINRGGTLDLEGLLFANRCTWAHAVAAAADLLGIQEARLLDSAEIDAIGGTGDPTAVLAMK